MKETNIEAELPSTAPNVHGGTYTVTHPKRGHWTVKCHTVQSGPLAGKRILSLLVGPDNVNSFAGVAFWDDEQRRAVMWKSNRSTACKHGIIDGYGWGELWNETEKKLAVWADLVLRKERGYWRSEGCELLLESRCVACNRKLTTPESIKSGIGPQCKNR